MAGTALLLTPDEQALRALQHLPPFSPLLSRLLAMLAHENVSFARIADLIEKDPVLAGNVLGVVNSALYGLRGQVNSVGHAVALLGINRIRNTALGMSIAKVWDRIETPPGWSMKLFNYHAIGVAILADLFCQESNVEYPEGAFVAGLLHDLGKLLIAASLPREYYAIQERQARANESPGESERQVLGFTHSDLSAAAIKVWNLPAPIEMAARFHHQPQLDPSGKATGRVALGYAVAAANQYVNKIGVAVGGYVPGNDQFTPDPLEVLGIEDQFQKVLDQFHPEFEGIRALF